METLLGWVTESRIAKPLRRLVVESRKGDPRTARTDKAVSYWVGGGGEAARSRGGWGRGGV